MHAAAPKPPAGQRIRVTAMLTIGTLMWIVVPLGVFALAAFVKVQSDSMSVTLLTTYASLIVATAAVVKVLSTIVNEYQRRDMQRRHSNVPMRTPVEPVLVLIALIALIAVTVWFHTSDACGIGAGMYVCG